MKYRSLGIVLVLTIVATMYLPVSGVCQRQPYPGFWPAGQPPKPKGFDFWSIWDVRSDVRMAPTTIYTLPERSRVLHQWLQRLVRQGNDLPGVKPEFHQMLRARKAGDIRKACRMVDGLFWKLENAENSYVKGRGSVRINVTDDKGEPVAEAEVSLIGTPLGAITDTDGHCRIRHIPITGPRYILKVTKPGFLNTYRGEFNPASERDKPLSLTMRKMTSENRFWADELAVKICRLSQIKQKGDVPKPLDTAVIDMALYPKKVLPYLEASVRIDSNQPAIRKLADELKQATPAADRLSSSVLARAVYNWIAEHIRQASIENYPGDVTCAQWQRQNAAWGTALGQWTYKASDVLKYRRATDIEYARLAVALLRALHIPARPAFVDGRAVCQWWVQLPTGNAFWTNMSTSLGRKRFKNAQKPLQSLAPVRQDQIAYAAIDEQAISYMKWSDDESCLWIQDYGRHAWSPPTKGGRKIARNRMQQFAEDGKLHAGVKRPSDKTPAQFSPGYIVSTTGIVLHLASVKHHGKLVFRFPEYDSNEFREFVETTHWTNHPQWVSTVRTEENKNDLTGEVRRWTVIEIVPGKKPSPAAGEGETIEQ